MPRGTISFSLFGIPVLISPYSWLILALLGGGLGAEDIGDMQRILIFVVVGMLALLVHEFGHALTARALGGDPQVIVIEGLGAATYSRPPAGKWPYFLMVLAGPLATLIPGLLAGVLFGLQCMGGNPAAGVVFSLAVPLKIMPPDWVLESINLESTSAFQLEMYFTMYQVSVWWCLFNLLPILPMDGGHLFLTLFHRERIVAIVGFVVSALIALYALTTGFYFMLMLFGYFAYLNWQFFRHRAR